MERRVRLLEISLTERRVKRVGLRGSNRRGKEESQERMERRVFCASQ